MGDAYRGLTIRIGADATPITRALSSINSASRTTERNLSRVSKALKQDPGNATLLSRQIGILGDQSKAAASQVALLQKSLNQAFKQNPGSKQALDIYFKEAETQAANLRRQYVSLDQTLESVYDTIIKYNMGVKNMSKTDATNALRNFREEARNSKNEVQILEQELRKIWTQDKSLIPFDTKNVDVAISKWKELRKQHQVTKEELASWNNAIGIKNLALDLELAESHLKQVHIEALNTKNALAQLGNSKGVKEAAIQQRYLAESTREAEATLRSMVSVTQVLPKSLEASTIQARSFEQVSKLLNEQIRITSERLKALDSSKVQKIEAEFITTKNAVNILTDELAGLKAKIESTEASISLLKEEMVTLPAGSKNFSKAEKEVERLNAELEETENRMYTVSARLKHANDAHAFRETEKELATLNGKLASHEMMLARANKKWGQFGANIRTAGYSVMATFGSLAFMGGMYAVQAAEDIDAAYRNMRKTVNGTEEQFEHLKDAAVSFSQTHFTSASQILEIEAIGGQLGIQVQNLEKFAEVVSNMDIATNLDTETISQNLGQLSNIMNDMDQDLQSGAGSMEAYGDALVRLGNNTAAQEDKIQNVMMRIASMGTICNMKTPDLLALASATAATGQGAEAAGTALSKTFSGIEAAVNGSQRALEKLQSSTDLTEDEISDLTAELEKGQLKLEKFAEIAGMSADEFKAAWNGDNVMRDAFKPFIEGLKRIDQEGGSVDATLTNLGITSVRQKQTLQGLTQTVDILDNSLTMSNDAWNGVSDQWGAAGDAAREAQRKSEGFSGQLEILKNNAKVLGDEILESLTPALTAAVDMLRNFVNGFKSLPDEAKMAAAGITAFLAVLGPAMIAFGTTLTIGSALKNFFTGQKQGWTLAKTAIEGGGDALLATTTILDKNGNALKKSAGLAEKFGETLFDAGSKLTDFAAEEGSSNKWIANLGTGLQEVGVAATSLTGKLIPIAAVLATVGIAAGITWQYFDRMQKKQDMLAKASESMADRIDISFSNIADKMKSEFSIAGSAFKYYDEFIENASKRNEELSTSANNLTTNLVKMRKYSNDISKLLKKLESKGSLNNYEFSLLSEEISEYNQITGESIQVTKGEDGAIAVLKDNVNLTASAFENLAKQKENAAKADYFQKEYNTAYENNMDAQIGKQQAQSALKQEKARLKALENDTTPKSGQELIDWQNEIAATEANISRLTDEIQSYKDVINETNNSLQNASKLTELFNNANANVEGTIENLIASNEAAVAAYYASSGTLSRFNEICKKTGVSADDLKKIDLAELFTGWDGSLQGLLTKMQEMNLVSLETYNSLKDLDMITIDDKEYFINDDGSIQWQEGQLQDLQDIVIDGKHYYVTDNGTIYDQKEELEGFNLFTIDDKQYIVTSGGTVLDEQGQCNELSSMVVNNKHYLVSNDGTIYDQKGELQALENYQLNNKTLYITTDGILTAEGELYTFNALGIDPKEYIVEDGDSVRIQEDKIESLKEAINSVPPTFTVTAQLDTTAFNNALANIKLNLASSILKPIGQDATGGFNKMLTQRNVALHAAGAFITNGTTYIGTDKQGVHHIAGEAGREFVQHHADGTTSIIPIQNRKYMTPFVSAVSEMLAEGQYNTVSREDLYKVTDAIIKSSQQSGDIVLVLDDREIARAVRKYA